MRCYLVSLILLTLQIEQASTQDGCSIAGKDNVCCQNSGVGPVCARCTSQCIGAAEGSTCNMYGSDCGGTMDCTSRLWLSNNADPNMAGWGYLASTTWTGYNWFSATDSNRCPIFNCILRQYGTSDSSATTYAKWGVKFENQNYLAKLQYDDTSCTQCTYGWTRFQVKCFTYYNAAAASPESTGVVTGWSTYFALSDSCDHSSRFTTIASPTITHYTFIIKETTAGYTDRVLTAWKATDWYTEPKTACNFEQCNWYTYNNWNRYSQAYDTTDNGDGENFVTQFRTGSVVNSYSMILRCLVRKKNGGTMWLYSTRIYYSVIGCGSITTITQPSSHTFYVADIGQPTFTYIYNSYTDFYAMQPTHTAYTSNCVPSDTRLYYTSWNNNYGTSWTCSSTHSWATTWGYMECNGANMGRLDVKLDLIWARWYKFQITAPGITTKYNAFKIETVCGSNSTTITDAADKQPIQQYQIHTGGYWNAPSSNGYKPRFWFSPFQNTQSLCGITTYQLFNSVGDQTAPTLLTMTQSSLSSTKYIWVDNSVNFTRGQYNFTIKATASGGRTFFTNFTVNVIYDCIYDNITFVNQIPSPGANGRANDMTLVDNAPLAKVTGIVGQINYYDLDLKSIIVNNASEYCPIEKYVISKVYNYSSGQVFSASEWQQRMLMNEIQGIWEFIDMTREYMNVYVHFMAYNGKIWSSVNGPASLDIKLSPKPFEDTIPPIFSGALFSIELDYNKTEFLSRDWESSEWRDKKNVTFRLPTIFEEHNQPVSVDFDPNDVPFAWYDAENNNITIDQSKITVNNEGLNEMTLILSDALGNKKRFVQDINVNWLKKNKTLSDQTDEVEQTSLAIGSGSGLTECPGQVVSISSTGELTIRLEQDKLMQGVDQTLFDSESINMFIDPYMARNDRNSPAFEKELPLGSLNFTWIVSNYENSTLKLKLQFNDGAAISPDGNNDHLIIQFSNLDQIFDQSKLLEEQRSQSCQFNKTIGSQFDNGSDGLKDSVKAVNTGLKISLILAIILSLFGNWSFWLFISVIRTYQIVIHLPLSRVSFPENVMVFFQMIRPLAFLDFLEGIVGKTNDDDVPENEKKIQFEQLDQMRELGYNHFSAFKNLSTVSILMCVYGARVVLYLTYQAYKMYKLKKAVSYEGGQAEKKIEADGDKKVGVFGSLSSKIDPTAGGVKNIESELQNLSLDTEPKDRPSVQGLINDKIDTSENTQITNQTEMNFMAVQEQGLSLQKPNNDQVLELEVDQQNPPMTGQTALGQADLMKKRMLTAIKIKYDSNYAAIKSYNYKKSIKKKKKKCLKCVDNMGNTLFFYEILRLFIEGYLMFSVASWLNFFAPEKDSAGTIFGYMFAVIALFICWILLPLGSIVMLFERFRGQLQDENVKKKIGAMYQEQKQRDASPWTLAYNSMFILRRFIFLMMFLPYQGPLTFELLVILLVNVVSLIYIGSVWALNRRLYNQLDFFDEYWICILTVHLVVFTDMVNDSQAKQGYGWIMIALMIFHLLIKFIFIVWENARRLYLLWQRYITPIWLFHIKPHLKCFQKKSTPEIKHELDIAEDPKGFSSNYLIIQTLQSAHQRISRRARLEQERKAEEQERLRKLRELNKSSSSDSESGIDEKPRAAVGSPKNNSVSDSDSSESADAEDKKETPDKVDGKKDEKVKTPNGEKQLQIKDNQPAKSTIMRKMTSRGQSRHRSIADRLNRNTIQQLNMSAITEEQMSIESLPQDAQKSLEVVAEVYKQEDTDDENIQVENEGIGAFVFDDKAQQEPTEQKEGPAEGYHDNNNHVAQTLSEHEANNNPQSESANSLDQEVQNDQLYYEFNEEKDEDSIKTPVASSVRSSVELERKQSQASQKVTPLQIQTSLEKESLKQSIKNEETPKLSSPPAQNKNQFSKQVSLDPKEDKDIVEASSLAKDISIQDQRALQQQHKVADKEDNDPKNMERADTKGKETQKQEAAQKGDESSDGNLEVADDSMYYNFNQPQISDSD